MVRKTRDEYVRDIQKQFLNLNERSSNLIALRKAYANGFQVTNGKEKESYKTLLSRVDAERKEIKNEACYLRNVREKLNNANILNRTAIMQVLPYLVSVIENEEYGIFSTEIPFFDDKHGNVTGPLFYNFSYLAKVSDEALSEKELEMKYPYALSAMGFNVDELFKGENYTGVALYKQGDLSDIIFSNEPINTISYDRQASFGYINDERFSYLNDFIDMIIDYKTYMDCEFGRDLDTELSYEDLYNLANQFIEERKVK